MSQPPGEYVLKLTVTDRASGRTGTLIRKATLLPAGFGLVGDHDLAIPFAEGSRRISLPCVQSVSIGALRHG